MAALANKKLGGHNKLQNVVPTPLGNYLRSVRENKGWSLREAASKIGLHNSVIGQIETGYIKELSVKSLVFLAKGYNVPLLQLIELMGYNLEE